MTLFETLCAEFNAVLDEFSDAPDPTPEKLRDRLRDAFAGHAEVQRIAVRIGERPDIGPRAWQLSVDVITTSGEQLERMNVQFTPHEERGNWARA